MSTPDRGELIVYRTEDGQAEVQLQTLDGSVWLNQGEMAELFDTSKQNVSLHIKNILKEGELPEDSVVKEYLTTAEDGKRYQTKHYNLHMILAVGYRVRSPRGTQFRQWATAHLAEYLVKGFVMDDERLKKPGGWDYFDELLARIREIRASEKRFYQKVRDLFALSSDYRSDDRADPGAPNMALTNWSASPANGLIPSTKAAAWPRPDRPMWRRSSSWSGSKSSLNTKRGSNELQTLPGT